jgi:HK97 gp10 family phage protein
MTTIAITVSGLDKTIASIEKLPGAIQRKVVAKAVKAATEPIVIAAKSRAPVRFGFMRDRIVAVVKKMQDGVTYIGMVGVMRGPQIPVGDVYTRGKKKGNPIYVQPTKYAHFTEMGTSQREATPFLRPALVAQAKIAVGRFQAVAEDELDTITLNNLDAAEGAAAVAAYNTKFGK